MRFYSHVCFSSHSLRERLPFLVLHKRQHNKVLSKVWSPPLLSGIMWSIEALSSAYPSTPNLIVTPQYPHKSPSLSLRLSWVTFLSIFLQPLKKALLRREPSLLAAANFSLFLSL